MRQPDAHAQRRAEWGAVLTVMVVAALMSAVAIYTVMSIALSQAQQAQFYQERLVARNAAEAGIIWAQQRLRVNEIFCADAGNDPPAALFNPSTVVDVTITPCGVGTSPPRRIDAKVTY